MSIVQKAAKRRKKKNLIWTFVIKEKYFQVAKLNIEREFVKMDEGFFSNSSIFFYLKFNPDTGISLPPKLIFLSKLTSWFGKSFPEQSSNKNRISFYIYKTNSTSIITETLKIFNQTFQLNLRKLAYHVCNSRTSFGWQLRPVASNTVTDFRQHRNNCTNQTADSAQLSFQFLFHVSKSRP